MKKTLLTNAILTALTLSTAAFADYPEVVIDSDIVLNYEQTLDLRSTVKVPTDVYVPDTADVIVNQFNHGSKIQAVAEVNNNVGVDQTTVNATAVGNNASITLEKSNYKTVGAVQGNQVGGVFASGIVENNAINPEQEVEVNVTAVGNNLSVSNEDIYTKIGSVQFNYESPVQAYGSISNNAFGVPMVHRDPALSVTAVGNNLSSPAPTLGSITQINRNSPVSAVGQISGNTGGTSIITLDATAVGNNVSIEALKL